VLRGDRARRPQRPGRLERGTDALRKTEYEQEEEKDVMVGSGARANGEQHPNT